MEVRIQLKICESCGCLWYRPQTQESIYCKNCKIKLQHFPSPDSRKRRGRPSLTAVPQLLDPSPQLPSGVFPGKKPACKVPGKARELWIRSRQLTTIWAVAEAPGGAL